MSIETAIQTLVSEEKPRHEFERAFAALSFSAYINWPDETFAATNLVFVGVTQAMMREATDNRDWLPLALEPERYWEQLGAGSGSGMFLPITEDVFGKRGYDETRYVADVVRFLLTYKPQSGDKRMRASLGRADAYINENGGFPDRKDGIGKRTQGWSVAKHQSAWTTYKRLAAFQFVRFYDSEIDWLFDPQDAKVLERAMEAAEDQKKVRAYFARVRWVLSRLKELLDPRSLQAADYPTIPETVQSVPCKLPRVPKNIYDVTSGYRRNRAESVDG